MDSQARIPEICRCFCLLFTSLSLSFTNPLFKTPSLLLISPLPLFFSLTLTFSHDEQNFSSEMDSTGRRPCFIEEDDGLASLADMEAGFSGNYQHPFFSRPMCYSRKGSLRNLSAMGSFGSSSSMSPRSGRFWDARFEEHQPHFLEACFLCKKPLGDNRDIFMYRGDTPFCSEECRDEQIEIDEAKEKNCNLSSSMKALRKREQRKSSSNSSKDYPFRPGTVAAA